MWLEEVDENWTLFLDRDGVINKRNFEGYITKVEDFVFIPHFLPSISILSQIFGKIIVVTNQQGIGKGIMNEKSLLEIHRHMIQEINNVGGRIDQVFYATNLKNEHNDRRKPLPNMGLEAQNQFPNIDFKKSIMIGDTNSDIQFGKSLGMKTILYKSSEKITENIDLVINDFKELTIRLKR
jgi:D-glycero-D-manno-heptose 1,7-bisphosphate phosphatase